MCQLLLGNIITHPVTRFSLIIMTAFILAKQTSFRLYLPVYDINNKFSTLIV